MLDWRCQAEQKLLSQLRSARTVTRLLPSTSSSAREGLLSVHPSQPTASSSCVESCGLRRRTLCSSSLACTFLRSDTSTSTSSLPPSFSGLSPCRSLQADCHHAFQRDLCWDRRTSFQQQSPSSSTSSSLQSFSQSCFRGHGSNPSKVATPCTSGKPDQTTTSLPSSSSGPSGSQLTSRSSTPTDISTVCRGGRTRRSWLFLFSCSPPSSSCSSSTAQTTTVRSRLTATW
mmetsp:Transcript_33386/g.74861  ORF Transcript_33386/g.74861 Transcript_33386/m.74861 type:complete len:230 (-) Transcript_33386:521-1210(-)